MTCSVLCEMCLLWWKWESTATSRFSSSQRSPSPHYATESWRKEVSALPRNENYMLPPVYLAIPRKQSVNGETRFKSSFGMETRVFFRASGPRIGQTVFNWNYGALLLCYTASHETCVNIRIITRLLDRSQTMIQRSLSEKRNRTHFLNGQSLCLPS